MPDAPTPHRTKIAAAAALLGASAVAAFVLGAGPAPSALQLAGASDDTVDDVSGNCDEAEHAADPECAGTPVTDDGEDDGTTSTTVDDTTSTTADDGAGSPADEINTIDAAGAGTVIYAVEGGSLRLVSATPASGWRVEVEQASGPEIELDFRSGTQRVQVNVELEDGQARERVRFRDDADDTDIRTEDGVVQDDNSGSGSGDDDTVEDDHSNSGPGSGDDDAVDDDNSGSGHGGDDDSSGHGSDD
jgi:hypothetical protein